MKKIALAAALSVSATGAFAGGMVYEPVMEPAVVVEESSSSSAGIVVPLLLLAVVAAVAASNN